MTEMADGTAHLSRAKITLHMPSSRNGRRFALVSMLLSQMQLDHEAVFPPLRRMRLRGLEAKAVQSPHCHLRWRMARHPDVLISDQGSRNRSGKTIHISYEFMNHLRSGNEADTLFLPILFHPNLLNKSFYDMAGSLSQSTDRPIGILFAGNCDPKTYDNIRIKTQYGLANRHELFQHVQSMPPELIFMAQSKEAFETALKQGALKDKFVWIDTEKFRIPQSEWLPLLAKARYFFCTPGVHYPYCQNLNEAAACGAVPILQYPDFYRPGLKHEKDCIAFADPDEIMAITKTLLAEGNADWVPRSKAVIKWHQDHLSLDHACNQIRSFLENPNQKTMTWVLAGK